MQPRPAFNIAYLFQLSGVFLNLLVYVIDIILQLFGIAFLYLCPRLCLGKSAKLLAVVYNAVKLVTQTCVINYNAVRTVCHFVA